MTLYGKHNLLLESGDALLLENGFNLLLESDFGASLENTNATTDNPNNYEQDDRSGFRQYPGDLIRDGQTGGMVRKKSYDPRHPQESIRSTTDSQRGPQNPEGEDVFLADGEVTGNDL